MKISLILKGREDKLGRIPVVVRMNQGNQRVYKTTRIRVTKDQFEDGKIIKHPQASLFNSILRKTVAQYELNGMVNEKKAVEVDLFQYWRRCISIWEATRRKKASTLRQYTYELSKLEEFRTCNLSDINNNFFTDLLKFCYNKGNSENGAWKTFSRVHAVLEQAVADDLLPSNPMNKFKSRPKYRDPQKDYLTKEQLIDVERFAITVDSKEQRFATLWFLIGCYTGMRYSDMITFDKKKHIKGGRLIKDMVKTTEEVISLPLSGKIKELLELVNYQPLQAKNQPYNRMLKIIAEKCDIDINLTAHSSRHTAAMLLSMAKVDIGTTARILGHSSTKHTKIYYKYANTTIDEAMNKIIK